MPTQSPRSSLTPVCGSGRDSLAPAFCGLDGAAGVRLREVAITGMATASLWVTGWPSRYQEPERPRGHDLLNHGDSVILHRAGEIRHKNKISGSGYLTDILSDYSGAAVRPYCHISEERRVGTACRARW